MEDAGIKLSSVATDITDTSGRAILAAMLAGERDPATLAEMSVRRLRDKIPALTQPLAGRFIEHHAFLVKLHVDLIDQHTAAIDTLTARIDEAMVPLRSARELITSIPDIGVSNRRRHHRRERRRHGRLRHPRHLASWAGVCPGHHESAGRKKSSKNRGKARTVVAIEHTLLTIVWTMLHTGEMYAELGPDYYARRDPSAPRPAPWVSSSRSATT